LYIESPGGVGFSHGLRNNNNTDETVARDNLQALIQFFRKFPAYKKNDFYISGESYAGVYVPTLAYEIVKYNKLPSREFTFKLKGIMVGNACTDPRECW
jgi:serine carboxypeptidase-like clade 2